MKHTTNIQTFLEKYYGENDSVILACSGGPDSMFLLYKILETNFSKNLVICYFNHKTRPETEDEEKFLEDLAKKKGCDFEVAECDFEKIKKLYPGKSFEELAREKRYQFFDAIMNIYNSKHVITGHHLDDRIETYMFNMLRGSKLTGLINMTESHGGILRPLLKIEKIEILQHLDSHSLHYFTDSTNTDTNITRNKMRHDILPRFGEIHPQHKKNIKNLLEYFEDIKLHIDSEVSTFLKNSKSFNIQEFHVLSQLLQKEVIRHIFYISNNNSTIGLSEANISEVLRFIAGPNGGTVKEIKNMKLRKEKGNIFF